MDFSRHVFFFFFNLRFASLDRETELSWTCIEKFDATIMTVDLLHASMHRRKVKQRSLVNIHGFFTPRLFFAANLLILTKDSRHAKDVRDQISFGLGFRSAILRSWSKSLRVL